MLAELRDADPDGGGLPRYVERELAAYLRCGILAHGFCRVFSRVPTGLSPVATNCEQRGSNCDDWMSAASGQFAALGDTARADGLPVSGSQSCDTSGPVLCLQQ